MAYSSGRAGAPWNRLRAQVFAEETHCWWCGKHVDQDLPRWHRKSRTVDHITPLALGGAPLDRQNCRLAHRDCNTIRSNQLRAAKRPRKSFTVDVTSL